MPSLLARAIPALLALMLAPSGCSSSGDGPPCEPGALSVYLTFDIIEPGVYSGPATVMAHEAKSSVTLAFDTGETITLRYELGDQTLPVTVGQSVEAYANLNMPFWSEATLVLREPGATGSLLAAVWDASGPLPPDDELAGLTISYVDADCSAVHDGCGERASLALEVPLGEEEGPTRVEAGTEVVDGVYILGNGRASGQFVGPIECTDIPQEWKAGYLLAAP